LASGEQVKLTDLNKARELEELQYLKLAESLNEKEQEDVARLNAKLATQGAYQSSWRLNAIIKLRVDKLKHLIDIRTDIRKGMAIQFPELGSEAEIDVLLERLNSMFAHGFGALRDSIDPSFWSAIVAHDDQELLQLRAYAKRQCEILKRELALNLHKKNDRAAVVSVSTGGGPSIINMGTIYGDVQQTIGQVNAAGQGALAALLEQLAKAIKEAESLGNERAAYLEQLQFIAEQTIASPDARRGCVVRGLLFGLWTTLQGSANVAQILSLVGPAMAQHFGFQWPF
jgi:hypothetical protein